MYSIYHYATQRFNHIKRKYENYPRYWPFVPGIHRSPRGFDVFFDLRLNKRLSKQSWGW